MKFTRTKSRIYCTNHQEIQYTCYIFYENGFIWCTNSGLCNKFNELCAIYWQFRRRKPFCFGEVWSGRHTSSESPQSSLNWRRPLCIFATQDNTGSWKFSTSSAAYRMPKRPNLHPGRPGNLNRAILEGNPNRWRS